MEPAVTPFVDVATVADHIDDPTWLIVDCRFELGDPDGGRLAYETEHLPGALFADLNRDLSGPVVMGVTGRHPLPSPEELEALFSRWGVTNKTQIVGYDSNQGFMAAARLWWLGKWVGHDSIAVLDGGLAAWKRAGLPMSNAVPAPRSTTSFTASVRSEMLAEADEIRDALVSDELLVVDSRSPDRYRGENETIDPVAGHIPGAALRPFADNFTESGVRPPHELANELSDLFDRRGAEQVVFYCGSGVTATANILAAAHSGLGLPRLYSGSWSHWITDPARPVATGSPSPNQR